MVQIFQPILHHALIYIDDILLFSGSHDEHRHLLTRFYELFKVMESCYLPRKAPLRLTNSWMAKTEENVLFKGKGFLVRASGGKEVAMAMIGKWYAVENSMGGVSGFESRESISGIRF